MRVSFQSSLFATMLLLAGFAAAAPVGDKGIDDVSQILYHISHQILRPQIMKRQPDDALEQLGDEGLAALGSDETVESSGIKQWWGMPHFLFALIRPALTWQKTCGTGDPILNESI